MCVGGERGGERGGEEGVLLIPIIGSAVAVEGGGVEQNDENGSGTSRSGR